MMIMGVSNDSGLCIGRYYVAFNNENVRVDYPFGPGSAVFRLMPSLQGSK
jgi:hypothetical protein